MVSFLKDKDMTELLEFLSQMKDHEGCDRLMETVSYVDFLESTLSSMMKQIVDMREEIKNVQKQNEYLVSRVDRSVKDILNEQLGKAEAKVQELHGTLTKIKGDLKQFAVDTVNNAKRHSNKVLLRMAEITHIRNTLTGIRDKVDKMVGSIDSLADMVEGYKTRAGYEAERREPEGDTRKTASYETEHPVSAVTGEQCFYQSGETMGTYEEEVQRFMADRVREGVAYECNQEAYEDFKAYYDKKRKAAGQAGREQTVIHKETGKGKR